MDKSLKIALDGKRAARNLTGLGNYSRYFIDTMSGRFPANEYRLYAAGTPCDRLKPLLERVNVSLVPPRSRIDRSLPSVWRSSSIIHDAALDGCDIYHGLSNEIPVAAASLPIPSVVTIHDVIWRRYPSDYKRADRAIYDFKYGRSARIADRVIAISECTRRDLISDFGIDPSKIDVIYQGCDPSFAPASADERRRVAEKYSLPERYFIAVGTVQGRKNQLQAVRALRALDADISLVIVGRRTDYAAEIDRYISQHRLSGRVIWLENAPFADLPALYSGAMFSSYTSRYEGFGIPVIESIACHTPVIAATGSCLEEAGGPGAIYVGPDDDDAMADAARRLADSTFLRDKLVDKGLRHIRRFNPTEFANRTMASYNKAILSRYLS